MPNASSPLRRSNLNLERALLPNLGWPSVMAHFTLAFMMKNLSLILGGLVLIGAGCTIPNQARYEVSSAAPGATSHPAATAADKEAVKEILQAVAKPLKLQDLTSSSLVPEVIVYYQEIDSNTPVKLIAWSEGDKIFIELAHWPDMVGETLPYRSTREYIESELQRRFADRSSVVGFKALAQKSPHPPR